MVPASGYEQVQGLCNNQATDMALAVGGLDLRIRDLCCQKIALSAFPA